MNETRDEKKRNGYFIYILFSSCFLFAIFATSLSFYRFVKVYQPEPVIDVSGETSEEIVIPPDKSKTPDKIDKDIPIYSREDNKPNDEIISNEDTNVSNEISNETSYEHVSEETSSEHIEPPEPGETKIVKVVYKSGSEIEATTNVLPGYVTNKKEIKVTNKSDVALSYSIKWKSVTNNFVNYQDLVYHIEINGRHIVESYLPKYDRIILASIPLESGEEHNIKVYIEYKNRNYDQSVDMNHSFAGVLIIDNVE